MTYQVNVSFDKESENWHAEGEYGERFLNMGARSLDVLIERTNLALSDLMEVEQFEVEYQMNQKLEVDYA